MTTKLVVPESAPKHKMSQPIIREDIINLFRVPTNGKVRLKDHKPS